MACKELRRLALTETRRARLGAIQIDDAIGNVKGITCRRRRGPGRGDLSCHACAFVERERGASVWDGLRACSNSPADPRCARRSTRDPRWLGGRLILVERGR